MPWSVVRKASNSAAASRSRAPFCLPDQPRSLTVTTSMFAGKCRLSRRGMFSSSSTRMSGFRFLERQLEERDGLFSAHTREVFQEEIQGVTRCKVLDEALHRYARAGEHQSSVHHLRVGGDNLLGVHTRSLRLGTGPKEGSRPAREG